MILALLSNLAQLELTQ